MLFRSTGKVSFDRFDDGGTINIISVVFGMILVDTLFSNELLAMTS